MKSRMERIWIGFAWAMAGVYALQVCVGTWLWISGKVDWRSWADACAPMGAFALGVVWQKAGGFISGFVIEKEGVEDERID